MKHMDDKEFNVLRSELEMRIGKLYEHNFTIVTLIIAAWSLILGSYIDCAKEGSHFLLLIAVLPAVIAVVSNFLLKQWKENFEGISSIAGYLTVFYEIPSIYFGKEQIHWGSYTTMPLFSNSKKTGFANKTFVLVSLGSVALSVGLILYPFFSKINSAENITQKWQSWVVVFVAIGLWVLWFFSFIANCTYRPLPIVLNAIFNFLIQIIEKDGFPAEKVGEYLNTYIFAPLGITVADLRNGLDREDKNYKLRKTIIKRTPWNRLNEVLNEER